MFIRFEYWTTEITVLLQNIARVGKVAPHEIHYDIKMLSDIMMLHTHHFPKICN